MIPPRHRFVPAPSRRGHTPAPYPPTVRVSLYVWSAVCWALSLALLAARPVNAGTAQSVSIIVLAAFGCVFAGYLFYRATNPRRSR